MKPKSTLRHFLCIASSTLLGISSVHAASSVTWDISPGTVGAGDNAVTGGLGAWNTTAGHWTSDGGVNNIAWDNLANDTAIFGGAASGLVTLGTAITLGGLTFDTAGYSLVSNTLTFGIAGNIAAHEDATIRSILAGSSAITKTGTGTLTLAGANTFSGALTVADGSLSIASINHASTNGSLGNSATAVTLGKVGGFTGTLQYTGASATSSKAFSPATGGTGAVEVSSAATTLTLSSVISGGGGLTKTGPGMLLFNGGGSGTSNNYTGPTVVRGGVLALGSAWDQGAQSLPGGLTGPTGGLSNLEINGGIVRIASFLRRNLGTGPSDFQITGGVSGFSLQQGDSYDSINVNNNANLEIVWGTATWNPSTLVLNDDAAGPPAGAISLMNKIDLNGATRTVAANSASQAGRLRNVIRNSGGTPAGLTKVGLGTLQLENSNTYNGVTTISVGTLDANTFAAININSSIGKGSVGGSAADLVLNGGTLRHSAENLATTNRLFSLGTSGGTLNSSAPSATKTLSFTATTGMAFNSELGTRTLTLRGSNSGNNTLAVLLTNDSADNATSLTKSDAGTWILNNNSNSYTGVTTISGGALLLNSATALPGGVETAGGTSNLTFNGGVLGLGFGDFTRDLNSAATTTAATFTGAGGWAAYGANRVVNLNNDSHEITWETADTGFNNQTLILGNGSATHTVEVQNPINLGTATRTIQVDNGAAGVDAKLSGVITGGAGGVLTKTGSGSLTLSNANHYTGLTTVNAGVLLLDHADALPGGIGTVGGTSNLTFNGGVLGLATGDFTRSLDAATTTTAATFVGAGGWAAYGVNLAVNLGGAAATIPWATADTGFNGKTVILGATSATHTVELLNPLDLGDAARTLQVDRGSAALDGKLSGNISGTGGSITRTGNGNLLFSGNMSQTGGLSIATVNGATTYFSGTNTFSGTTVNAFSNPGTGSLVFQGIQALSPNSNLQQTHVGGVGGFGTIKILDDSATPASRSSVNLNMISSHTSHGMSLFVGNNNTANGGNSSGTTTGSTITLGNLNFTANGGTSQTLNVSGAGSYRLQINNVNLPAYGSNWTAVLSPSSPLTVAGNVQAVAGNPAGTMTLQLDGTAAGKLILGDIKNSLDGTAKMLALSKTSASTWTLSGTGSNYTGSTTVTAGTLAGIGANAFGNTSGISIGGSGTLSLRGDADTSFVKASDSSLYTLANSASGATINVDQATGAGSSLKTMAVGTLNTTSVAAAVTLNFTGANNTSLSVGAISGPVSTAAATTSHTNNIASTGTLTIASYTGRNTTAGETLTFNGTGTTTVTGAITPSATTLSLTKSGAGKTTLSGSNTYTGATAVNVGTLALVGGSQTSPITVASGAKLGFTLGSPTTSTKALTLSPGHGIAITGTVNHSSSYKLMTASAISGTPTLAVAIPDYELQKVSAATELWLVYTGPGSSAYGTWKASNAPTGDPDDDFDGDGVSNAVEFVLGGDKNTNDLAKLPVVGTSGANMTFSFKRDQDSIDLKTAVMIEVGTDLVTWPTPPSPYAVPDGATVNSPGVTVQKGIPEGGTDTVTLTLPLAPDATKFARLKVVISP